MKWQDWNITILWPPIKLMNLGIEHEMLLTMNKNRTLCVIWWKNTPPPRSCKTVQSSLWIQLSICRKCDKRDMLNYTTSVQSANSRLRKISVGQMAWWFNRKSVRKERRGNLYFTRDIKDRSLFKWARLTAAARNTYLVGKVMKKCKQVIKARLVERNYQYKDKAG